MISIDWEPRIIFVPQADLTPLGGALYELNVNSLWSTLKDLEDDETGIPFPDTHVRRESYVIAGVTYAPSLEIINGYQIEFEDGQYSVNVVGGNSNVGDVRVQNQVSINTQNSGGLIQGNLPTAIDGIPLADALADILAMARGGIVPKSDVLFEILGQDNLPRFQITRTPGNGRAVT